MEQEIRRKGKLLTRIGRIARAVPLVISLSSAVGGQAMMFMSARYSETQLLSEAPSVKKQGTLRIATKTLEYLNESESESIPDLRGSLNNLIKALNEIEASPKYQRERKIYDYNKRMGVLYMYIGVSGFILGLAGAMPSAALLSGRERKDRGNPKHS